MSAQIIKLADRRPRASSSVVDTQLSLFAAYLDVSLAAYLSVVDAAEEVWKATCSPR